MFNETEQLARIKNADHEAFRLVFDLYLNKVYQFVLGYVKNKADAEDIVQNTFHKLWMSRQLIDTEKFFSGFLFTIAYRQTIDHIRKNKNRERYIVRFMHLEEPASDTTAEHLLTKHQLHSSYREAVDALSPKRKEVFLLSRDAGLSNKEIAEHLQLSVKTVESHMTAALCAVHNHLKRVEVVL